MISRERQKVLLHGIELGLACVVIVGVVVSFIFQIPNFIGADWSQTETFMSFLEAILHLAVGIELARLLISYNISTVIELLVFVLARKILLYEESSVGLVLLVLSVIALFASRYFFIKRPKIKKAQDK